MKKKHTEAVLDSAEQVSQEFCRRVRELRSARGWSLEVLASASGVSRSMLSQIERNQANPTLAVTVRIAQAFGLSLGELVETTPVASAIHVIRSENREYHYRSDDDCRLRTLSPLHLEKDVEFYELALQPLSKLASAAHFVGTREFVTVQKGRLRITSGDETVELARGDSASYRADVEHSLENVGRSESTAFLVVIYD
jgi:transcriptional regulator with XRE-family HTH domain